MKKLLMLSAKSSEITFILTARNMGYYVYTTGYKDYLPGHRYADEYIPCDYSDYEKVIELCKNNGISAISHGCNDFCALSAAYVGNRLGFKGHDSYEVARIIHQKDAFKDFAQKNKIKSPKAICFESLEEAYCYELQDVFPVIVKPINLAGGAGVSVARNKAEYVRALDNVKKWSKEDKVVVEQFVQGSLHSISTFLIDRKVEAYGTSNDYSYMNKYLTNTGLFPADKWDKAKDVILAEIERIASILDLTDGLLHLQYIMDQNNEPWIIEMMRRSPGNNYTIALSEHTGINWREWILRAEAGENLAGFSKSKHTKGYYGYHSAMSSADGIYLGTEIDPGFIKNIFQIEEWHEPGYVVSDYLNDKVVSVQFYLKDRKSRGMIKNINDLVKVKIKKK